MNGLRREYYSVGMRPTIPPSPYSFSCAECNHNYTRGSSYFLPEHINEPNGGLARAVLQQPASISRNS